MVVTDEDHVLGVLLDRLVPLTARTTENLEKIRRIAHKINGRVNNTDKTVKAKSLNMLRKTKSERMVDIVKLFEKTRDKSTCANLAAVIHACIAPKSGQTRISALKQLMKLEASKIFMKLLMESKSVGAPDVLVNELLFVLGQLSQKDGKFSKHAEVLSAAKTFHQHLKNNIKNVKLITPLLMCFKTLTKNENIVSVILKDGFLLTLEKLLRENNTYLKKNKQWAYLVLANVTRKITEENCDRIVRSGLMQYALDVFDVKLKSASKLSPKIISSALDTLVHIANTNNGRTALRKSNKLNVLYKFSVRCPDEQMYDSTMSKLYTVIIVCREKLHLPLSTTRSAYVFGLDDTRADGGDESDEGVADSDDSEGDDNEFATTQHFLKPSSSNSTAVRTFEVSFNDWKDREKLVSTYGRLFKEFNDEITPEYNATNKFISNIYNIKQRINTTRLNENLNTEKNDIRLLANVHKSQTHKVAYLTIAKRVNSVAPFVKVAYPDWIGADFHELESLESLYNTDVHVSRDKLSSCLKRTMTKRRDSGVVVYDLDDLLEHFNETNNPTLLSNDDEKNLGAKSEIDHLNFESRFESGNLRKAIKTNPYEYDLILNSDVNSISHNQWFYFQVSNTEAFKPYVFNVVNMENHNSQYRAGMQPIVFSVKSHLKSKTGWKRTGTDVCYNGNFYKSNTVDGSYMTASFTVQFPFDNDVCYVAYVYPYTYSTLMYKCFSWKNSVNPATTLFRVNSMCRSLNNNEVPIITITSAEDTGGQQIKDRPIVYLTSRVHPGETSSSWVIDGVIEYLCGDTITAKKARDAYVFKIVPMLNVEGVINGCHRCGLTDEDLNRKWRSPDPKRHPEIFHARGILEYMAKVMKTTPYVFCDFHGHSNRKNCFFFGCSAKKSWLKMDLIKEENATDFTVLPILMQNCCPSFSLQQCDYKIERNRETTARITVWRCYGVKRSYTLETSYCGCDEGLYKGFHFGIKQLREIGSTFCMSLSSLREETEKRTNSPATNQPPTVTTSLKSMDFVDEEQSDSD